MIRFVALDTETVRALQAGQPDANGQIPERHVSDGSGVPCRHCLGQVGSGEPYLILSHRPFPTPQPYAEQGPIFLHADPCRQAPPDGAIPAMLERPSYIVRGYGSDDRIVYGSGSVVATDEIPERAEELLADPATAYLHVRSAANNCYQCRIERG